MGPLGALFITLSGLSPSIGVFVVASDVIHAAGTAAFLCFAAAGVLGLAIAGVYAELASAWPETGANTPSSAASSALPPASPCSA
ncbi:MAG: hypothetical protein WDN45_13430 [Caulobacteraceae bacterium]